MESSDDEGVAVAQSVMNYNFVDENDEFISFSVLPIQWSDGEGSDLTKKQVFLHGTADSGFQKIYKQVIAWKLELSGEQPEISVLSKEKHWIKLQKPRKVFEDTIRTILITVHCLHFLKQNPETLEKFLWDHLRKVFSLFEVRPSENDLLDHLPLISAAVNHDETLSKSKFLLTFIENPKKRNAFDEDIYFGSEAKKSRFIVDDDDELDEDVGAESDEETDLFDSVCAICDNGGDLLCCEGRCLRSFHATVSSGGDSDCKSLGLSKAQVKAIQNFLCLNCQYKQHQCFACGKLGSSDKSSGAEVFPCVSATCGYFYHPECVSKLLHPGNEFEAEEFQKKIAAGESFTCPVHKCLVCKQRENMEIDELQFAVCRRCPKAYHRKCLPRKIAFEESEDKDAIRAWDGLLPNNRVLIYCLKHKIDTDLKTPLRNHIIFPNYEEKKRTFSLGLNSSKGKVVGKRRIVVSEDSPNERIVVKASKHAEEVSYDVKEGGSTKKKEKHSSRPGLESSEKSKITDVSRKPLKDGMKSVSVKVERSSPANERRVSLGVEKSNSVLNKGSEPVKSNQQEIHSSKLEKTIKTAPLMKKQSSPLPLVDAETKKRMVALMEKKSSSITLEEIIKCHKVPSTHAHSSKNIVDKTITQGKVEGFVEAVRTALQKLEGGGSVEDAKAVCGPEILKQIMRWKNKLKVYLSPFLHGMRYTSFGRHFTKVDKLKEIVDKLHSYVQNGDMIVDFCCGANDFSCLMKEKLDETGKKCSFKNFDVIQPKNDFNFEKRDWMSVRPKDLPTGSKLIMGLNPPFGVKAALANKFIDKALEFKPKLLILIVPQETERLDKKEAAYDLVWEDGDKLSGKSFYLPGSVDVNDKQMEQWNLKPPHLYLWSRPDWSVRHKVIASKQGHIPNEHKEVHVAENDEEAHLSDHPMDVSMDISPDRNCHGEMSRFVDVYSDISSQKNDLPEQNKEAEPEEAIPVVPKDQKEGSLTKSDTRVDQRTYGYDSNRDHNNNGHRRKRSGENPKDWPDKRKQSRGMTETPPGSRPDFNRSQVTGTRKGVPHSISSPFNRTDPGSLVEGYLSEAHVTPSERIESEGVRHFQPGLSGSGLVYGTGYGGSQTIVPREDLDDIERRYSLNDGVPFTSGINKWSSCTSLNHEYGNRRLDEQLPGYMKDTVNSFGRTPYTNELDEYRRDTDVRQLLRIYGRQDTNSLSQRSSYLPTQDVGFSRGVSLSSSAWLPGSTTESSYGRTNSTTMQRYAPRLDELNHSRMGTFGSETQLMGRSGVFDGSQHNPGSRTGIHPDTLGFAAAPPRSFSHQNSSGWLNE